MEEQQRQLVRTGKGIVWFGWILVPLVYLLLQQFVAVVGWFAFGLGILALCVQTIKYLGKGERWIPGYAKKKEEERRKAHYFYHCERNPEAFARLCAENFEREEQRT